MRGVLRSPLDLVNPKHATLWLDRPLKETWLRRVTSSTSGGITVVTGPDGGGKSALLKSLLVGERFVLWLDLHEHPVETGPEILVAFAQATGYLMPPQELLGSSVFSGVDPLKETIRAMELLSRLLRQHRASGWPNGRPPIVLIDQLHLPAVAHAAGHTSVHRKRKGQDQHMSKLLDYLLYLAENHLAHVVIGCSNGVADEIDHHTGFRIRRERVYIDYPRSSNVRRFLATKVNDQLRAIRDTEPLDEEALDTIIEVCGGHMQDLTTVVSSILNGTHWSAVLKRLLADDIEQVQATTDQILEAPYLVSDVAELPKRRLEAYHHYLRAWKLIELLAQRKYVTRSEVLNRVFTDTPHELDDLVNEALVMSINPSAATKVFQHGGAVVHHDRLIAATSPCMRKAFQMLLADERQQLHRDNITALIEGYTLRDQAAELQRTLQDAIAERAYFAEQRRNVVWHRDTWVKVVGGTAGSDDDAAAPAGRVGGAGDAELKRLYATYTQRLEAAEAAVSALQAQVHALRLRIDDADARSAWDSESHLDPRVHSADHAVAAASVSAVQPPVRAGRSSGDGGGGGVGGSGGGGGGGGGSLPVSDGAAGTQL